MIKCAGANFSITDPLCKNVLTDTVDAYTDVHSQFNNALTLFISGAAITFLSLILKFLIRNENLATGIVIGGLLSLASVITMHTFRFDSDGYFCSGDFNPSNIDFAPLSTKGAFIYTFIVGMWILFGFFFLICFALCAFGIAAVKNAQK